MIDGCPLPHDGICYAILDDEDDVTRCPQCHAVVTYDPSCVFVHRSEIVKNSGRKLDSRASRRKA